MYEVLSVSYGRELNPSPCRTVKEARKLARWRLEHVFPIEAVLIRKGGFPFERATKVKNPWTNRKRVRFVKPWRA
jgi:hypothetical protein